MKHEGLKSEAEANSNMQDHFNSFSSVDSCLEVQHFTTASLTRKTEHIGMSSFWNASHLKHKHLAFRGKNTRINSRQFNPKLQSQMLCFALAVLPAFDAQKSNSLFDISNLRGKHRAVLFGFPA